MSRLRAQRLQLIAGVRGTYDGRVPIRRVRRSLRESWFWSTLYIAIAGLIIGALTAYAQGWLPPQVSSLANSAGSWSLAAFLLVLVALDPWRGAFLGFVALITMLFGYVAAAAVRGYPAATSTVTFWVVAALVAGPVLGIAAVWVQEYKPWKVAVGIAVISGLLVGEAIYGLMFIADTTYPPYWYGELAVGLLILLVGFVRLRARRAAVLSTVLTALVAGAFYVGDGANLMAF